MRLSIIMPVHNERPTLAVAVERVLKTDLPVDVELVIVDDGSHDGAVEELDVRDRDDVVILRHERNRGKGAAVRTGLQHASGDLATVLDADLEYDPADYRALLEPMLAGEAEVAYGTRSFGSQTAYSFWYVLGNKALAFWASFLYNSWLSDIETCYKVAPLEVWRSLDIRSSGFGIEAEVTGKLLKRGYRIFEVPISYKARTRAEGKKLEWTDGLAALWILLRIRLGRRPRPSDGPPGPRSKASSR